VRDMKTNAKKGGKAAALPIRAGIKAGSSGWG
jgi:hypothetical protein